MQLLCAGNTLGEGQSRSFSLEGRKLLAVRRNNRAFVYLNSCPHLGIPLEWQPDRFLDASGSLIQCATHGALFLIDSGKCVSGPCAGERLPRIDCREDGTGIWVRL
ncbi:hypothetical protein AvCA_42610 [Azotobacter vinelandii CA]|uniref:Rieske domain-containing protein n=2 Tax=Azotobacter vinelandii TaxID=354 RepID=C1DFI8_AZOVD|nr:Rieske (2Fe-2S) protein [Azotobacter vinelandii]ACO80384.1 conserved hypothetical protein [Azotobacter vinelandii DJ]AGK14407.1 hypothetical protein AvCA_42610 [Azotobacter vinelandii CA]AGK21898.1 hypothetical protein AvCA6_42610 [Azotobacter vinelandii CA6]WKN21165.1 Rieske (2Fe-2S) protein [Azotobacter vinelandii]SFX69042.1 Ferredoxin subunit of nitrite reductase or a ring-hydroxylating dioxygenase [Azotobacter vinelandii]